MQKPSAQHGMVPFHSQDTIPVAVLLSTYNGAAFLSDLLASLKQQTYTNWILLWRDDGSTDTSVECMRQFTAEVGAHRCRQIVSPPAHIGVVLSYATLLEHVPSGFFVAFCDQDDVWFPNKLERGVTALKALSKPVLYCSRQRLTDTNLRPIGISPRLPSNPCFQMALTQNIATGCTIMLTPSAVSLLQGSLPPPKHILHDWWAYLVVTGADGVVITDNQPTLLYRQHSNNAVGAPALFVQRALAALKRGPWQFMSLFRDNLVYLNKQTCLSLNNSHFTRALHLVLLQSGLVGRWHRWRMLERSPKLRRYTWPEQFIFRLWFLWG
ncbi:glycosyltransferase family 2 protein [Acetobacter pomorum]|uniref:Glycosyltransferase family 2 protein n=1 Tax=Acetobacter pomorum TaxID=65959 RepID=A0A2G4RDE0_9PROT|nr:alpha-L-Rha alpha-1,3-L-rhamnosyltransferase [Acetobacter aceti 1023]PHY94601.1 glycosyltransferase family 2 protein [Acetobacter pomorum]